MPKFEKGHEKVGGRRTGSKNKWSYTEFLKSLQKMERREKKKLFEEIIKSALNGDQKMRELVLKKLLPDKIDINQVLGTVDLNELEEMNEDIKKTLRKRFSE